MIVSPSYENAAEWPVGLSTFGGSGRDLRDHVVVEEPRVVARAAVLAAQAPDREAHAAGAGRLVGAAEDHAGVVAAELVPRVGLVAAGELEVQELRLLGPAQRHLDDVEAVALRLARSRTGCCRPAGGGCRDPARRSLCASRTRRSTLATSSGLLRVADVEDVQALEAGRDGLAVAGLSRPPGVRRPRSHEDAAPDDDVALARGTGAALARSRAAPSACADCRRRGSGSPLNWPWYAVSPQNARSVLNRLKSFGATLRSEKPSCLMLRDVAKFAPPSSGGGGSAPPCALPSVCSSEMTWTGCADAATGTARHSADRE